MTSSQQTNEEASQVVEKEFVAEDEEGNLVEAVIDEVDASIEEIKAPLILTEIPVAPDVQVQETKEYMDTKTEEITEPVSVIEEPLKVEESRNESSQGISDITESKSESEETMAPRWRRRRQRMLDLRFVCGQP